MKDNTQQISKTMMYFLAGLAFFLILCAFCTSTVPLLYAHIRNLGVPAQMPMGNTPIDKLEQRVVALEQDQNSRLSEIAWALDQKLYYITGAALFISSLAAFLGWKSYKDLEEKIRKKIDETLEQQLYQLDPTNLKIWLVSYEKPVRFRGDKEGEVVDSNVTGEMQRVRQRIELTGLKNIRELDAPDRKCYRGVTIIPVFDQEMEFEFRRFLENNQNMLQSQKAAFILYTRDYRVSQKDTLDKYENLVTANMPATAASMILTVGRGLENEKTAPKKEGA